MRFGDSDHFALARFNTDGSLDQTFGGGDGLVTTEFAGSNSGRFYHEPGAPTGRQDNRGGLLADRPDFGRIRFRHREVRLDGGLDTTFVGGDGLVTTDLSMRDEARRGAAAGWKDPRRRVQYRGAHGPPFVPPLGAVLLRLQRGWDLDPAFGGGDGIVKVFPDVRGIEDASCATTAAGVLVQPDGRIVVTGRRERLPGLARFKPDGTPDPTFGMAMDMWHAEHQHRVRRRGYNFAVGRQAPGAALAAI